MAVNHVHLDDTQMGYVLRYPSGALAALDTETLVPYAAHYINEVKIFSKWADAIQVQMLFPSSKFEIDHVSLEFTVLVKNCGEDLPAASVDPFKRGHRR